MKLGFPHWLSEATHCSNYRASFAIEATNDPTHCQEAHGPQEILEVDIKNRIATENKVGRCFGKEYVLQYTSPIL